MSCNSIHILALQHAGAVLDGKSLVPRFLVCSRTFLHSSIVPLLMNFSASSFLQQNNSASSSAAVLDEESRLASINSNPAAGPNSHHSGDNFFLRADQWELLALFSQSSTLQFASKFTYDACSPNDIETFFVDRLLRQSSYGARSVTALRLSAISGDIVEGLTNCPALKVLDLSNCNKLFDRTLMLMSQVFAVKKKDVRTIVTPSTSPSSSSSGDDKENDDNNNTSPSPKKSATIPLQPRYAIISSSSPYPAPRLSKLSLAHNNVISCNGFKWIGSFAPYLSYFNVSYSIKVDEHCLKMCLFGDQNQQQHQNTTNHHLRELNISCTSVASLESFVPLLKNLYKLEVSSCNKLVGDSLKCFGMYNNNNKNKNNDAVDHHHHNQVLFLQEQNPLHELILSSNRQLTDDNIAHLKDPLPYLRRLDLSYCTGLSCKTIENTLSKATFTDSLRVLNIGGLPNIFDRGFSFLSALTSLQVLNVSNSPKLTNLKFVRSMVELRVLNCSGCTALVDISALEDLSSSSLAYNHQNDYQRHIHPQSRYFYVYQVHNAVQQHQDGQQQQHQQQIQGSLKVLCLAGCTALADEQLKHLSRLCVTSLERLDLSTSTRFSNWGLQFLTQQVGEDKEDLVNHTYNDCSLRELYLANCRRISDLSFALLMKNLQILGVNGCNLTTTKNQFQALCPLVRVV